MFDFSEIKICCNDKEIKLASDLFSHEINLRTGKTPEIVENAVAPCMVFSSDKNIIDKDFYKIQISGGIINITANGIRGIIFGYGRFLRKTLYGNGKIFLVEDISGEYKPSMKIRGHQLGYRDTPNTYDAWSVGDYVRYIKELMYFGCNTFEHTVFDDVPEKRNRLMKYSEDEFLEKCTKAASELDVDVSVWYPNDEKTLEESIKDRIHTFEIMPRIDAYFPPGGDPGEYPADEFINRTIEISKELKKIHPEAKTFPSAQSPHENDDWGDVFIREMEKLPTEIDGVITGPNWALPLHELRERLPMQYPVRLYPDITHNVRCEYPVHFDRNDWHYALAAPYGREACNPRPTEMRKLHRLTRQYVVGSVSYSEGVHDDVNKIVWSDMDFNPDVKLIDTLHDYARLFFYGADTEKAVSGILGLEKNWDGDPAENPHIECTLKYFRDMLKETPDLCDNWRFMLLLFRAECDMLIKTRRVFENELVKESKYHLKNNNIEKAEKVLKSPYSDDYNKLHDVIFKMGGKLFDLIGIQLDVENYCALSWERGAVLDTIDNPVTDRKWLTGRLDYCKALPEDERKDYIKRLLDRDKTDSDEFKFSFAENDFIELGVSQKPYFYMDFQGDRPNVNNGTIPMSMLKVYDHYSFEMKTGGLVSDCDYELRLNIKPRYRDNVTEFTIEINGTVIYKGMQYGGERDEKFDKEMSAPGFELHKYRIPKEIIRNGCVNINIHEPLVGIMISEIKIVKAK